MQFKKPEPVKVEFINEWMGNPPGSRLIIWSTLADRLERQGTIKLIPDKKKIEEVIVEEKEMESPPKDKMIKKNNIKTK